MKLGEKGWTWMAAASDDAFVAAAIAHLGYVGLCFAYLVDRTTGRDRAFQALVPLGIGASLSPSPDTGRATFYHLGGYLVLENRPRRLLVRMNGFGADIRMGDIHPWDATWSLPAGGYDRTQKAMGMPAKGEVWFGTERRPFEGLGMVDWTFGVPARETEWKWAAGVGFAGGRVIGWNLRTGFGDPTGAENAVWVDGEVRGVGPAVISPGDAGRVWDVRADGLDLWFQPDGERRENLNLGLIASRYAQPWGRYEGSFEGEKLVGFGVTENHWARW